MAAPHIPTEIAEYIIDMLAGDIKSLLTCSLVSTSWYHRSRSHLFSDIRLYSPYILQMWFTIGLGPSSHYVRSLDLTQGTPKWITPKILANISNDFTPFCNVQSLSLTSLDLTEFDENSITRIFGHFSENLTSLNLNGLTAHPDALLFFICMFPKLNNIKLNYPTLGKSTIPFQDPTITPKFRGRFALSNLRAHGTSLLAPILCLPIAFEDVSVENCRFETPQPLKDLFIACRETMKSVKLCKIFFDSSQTPLIDLSPCEGVEVVRLSLAKLKSPSVWIEPILQTVTSTRVRKIIFDADREIAAADIDSKVDVASWSRLDEMFLEMANALGPVGGRFELVFNALVWNGLGGSEHVEPGRFLERCRAEAVVKFGIGRKSRHLYRDANILNRR